MLDRVIRKEVKELAPLFRGEAEVECFPEAEDDDWLHVLVPHVAVHHALLKQGKELVKASEQRCQVIFLYVHERKHLFVCLGNVKACLD